MKNWYNLLVDSVWFYYRFKFTFVFNIKLIIIIKLYSMFLDCYFGHFPKIFQNTTFKLYKKNFLIYFDINVILYWKFLLLFIIIFLLLLFWFFFRFSISDWKEIEKREDLLKKKKEKNISIEKNLLNNKLKAKIMFKDKLKFNNKINVIYYKSIKLLKK